MVPNPYSHQEIHVFLDKIPYTSKFSGVKAMIIFEFYRIQIDLNPLSTLEYVHMCRQMIISVDSNIITISSSVKYRDHGSPHSEYTRQDIVLSKI